MDINAAQPSIVFNFATDQGVPIVYLHAFTFVVCLIVALIVSGILLTVAIRFRHREGDGEPRQDEGNLKIEITWTVLTGLVLFTLAIMSIPVMLQVNPPVGSRQPDVVVIGHQWWWEYRYPKSGIVTANELYLPEGVNSLLEIRAADVIHSFWVPDFGEKMDAIPGHPNHIFFKPNRSGLFLGTCAEFCGAQHALMRILVHVVSPQQFDAWTQQQLKIPSASGDATAQHGQQLFMSKTCVQCHSISGTAAQGKVAPDLTHIASRKTIGAGVLGNTTDNLAHWIKDPQQFKPGIYMPRMRLNESDAHDIAVYLEALQ